ncbi:hypothetical protein MTR_4g031785 [Medicago truncatula]|uniref:DUF4283 domain protein n=1 Tax=Medicago truncatula TaxID=3880 RepID=A0A072UTP3_MEDTR|nr:hypothetical protein MTR_4g031785 [Medicago truncatula]
MENTAGWKMVPLGKGYYDFHFESADDLRRIWAAGTVNLKPGRYNWRERILKEIASAVGTPIDIDGPTRNHTFGHYARILVDIDPSKITFDEILVERDGFAFKFEVQYERRPLFCHHYFSIGNDVSACRWLRPQPPKDKNGRGKQIIVAEAALPPKPTWQNNNNNDVVAYFGPISLVTSTVASSQMDASLSSNSFSFPLHNVFDNITPRELRHVMPELENPTADYASALLSDVVEYGRLSPRELEESPKGSHDSEHNRSSPRELEESLKGPNEGAPHTSHIEHHQVHEVSVELVEVHTDIVDEHIEVHSGSHATFELPVVVEPTTSVSESVPTEEEHLSRFCSSKWSILAKIYIMV